MGSQATQKMELPKTPARDADSERGGLPPSAIEYCGGKSKKIWAWSAATSVVSISNPKSGATSRNNYSTLYSYGHLDERPHSIIIDIEEDYRAAYLRGGTDATVD